LGLSSEQVTRYRELFLEAIEWYDTGLMESAEINRRYVHDPEYSLLLVLKGKVQCRDYLRSETEIALLEDILNKYLPHLHELRGKPWIRKEAVQRRLDQLAEVTVDGLLRVKPQ
jgi:hypothetical protein